MALPSLEIEKREKANLEKYRGCKSKKAPEILVAQNAAIDVTWYPYFIDELQLEEF